MIDRSIKQVLGQMMKGVEVVGATHDGVSRAYCSHWVTQVSFEEPVVMASVSPKHETYPLMIASGLFAVSLLAHDQVAEGQYFSYPGRKFLHLAQEYVSTWLGLPVVPNSLGWLRCEIFDSKSMLDHELLFARVTDVQAGRLREAPLLYSSRLGWRMGGDSAREPGESVRDALLARLSAMGVDASDDVGSAGDADAVE
jgi:flavin reductase (DIM6/NTAB) family NADH-FMN oxidoreductase RutF